MKVNLPKLGIVAGNGLLPAVIAGSYKQKGGDTVIAGIANEVDIALIEDYTHKIFPIGAVGQMLSYFKEESVQDVILIGGIKRPEFKTVKPDLTGAKLLAKILKSELLGDDNILRVIADYIESHGFKVIPPQEILSHIGYHSPRTLKARPSKSDLRDISIGANVLEALGICDVGQSVMVHDGYVLGIEAAEGTDNLIARCAYLRKTSTGGVLVKASKKTQDRRLDLPTIGSKTIKLLKDNNFHGVAIEDGAVIVVAPKETSDLADNSGIFITAIK